MEEFKWVPGYEGLYEISKLGRLRDYNYKGKNGKGKPRIEIIEYKPNGSGYIVVKLKKNNIIKRWPIHQLVAMAFLNHIPDGHKLVVDHLDKNKLNNRIENLRILTNRDNCSRREREFPTGVSWHKNNKKFISLIQINGKLKYLGSFNSASEASEAYQQALNSLKNT